MNNSEAGVIHKNGSLSHKVCDINTNSIYKVMSYLNSQCAIEKNRICPLFSEMQNHLYDIARSPVFHHRQF